jgi:NAD(P)-dependent dehydrogenase (short-subunit alcohol dehydrogenase family)
MHSPPPARSGRLESRRILITGAASGIGKAVAELFVAEGARIALLDRDGAGVATLASSLNSFSTQVNVANENQVQGAVEAAADALGGLDGIVNGAGIAGLQRLAETELLSWRQTLDVNLTGPLLITRAALPFLENNASATIVNVASGIALRPFSGQGAYAASKAGLLAWTKVLAQELAPKIRVNATCPGATDTPLMRANMPANVDATAFAAQYALKRQGSALEQAQAVLFLTGPESTFITGVSLAVDGGRTFH